MLSTAKNTALRGETILNDSADDFCRRVLGGIGTVFSGEEAKLNSMDDRWRFN